MSDVERAAIEVGRDKTVLRARLMEARSMLVDVAQCYFGEGTFDFENKRLISDDGTRALQWKIRTHPDKPVSHHNQQTSVGAVVFVLLGEKS